MTLYKLQYLLLLLNQQEEHLIGYGKGVYHMTSCDHHATFVVYVLHSMYNPKAKLPSAFDPLSNTNAPLIKIPSSTLRSEWLKMVNNEHLSDVQFYHKMECYHGHKVVLCAASELFWRMFEIGRKLEREESSSQSNTKWCSRWLTAFNRQSNVPVGAFKNIYDK